MKIATMLAIFFVTVPMSNCPEPRTCAQEREAAEQFCEEFFGTQVLHWYCLEVDGEAVHVESSCSLFPVGVILTDDI